MGKYKTLGKYPNRKLHCSAKPGSSEPQLDQAGYPMALNKQPNPYPAARMTPVTRRAELCAILALGLLRLKLRNSSQLSDHTGESSLHYSPDQWLHATPTQERIA